MFGYVTVNRPEMKVKDLELYRSYYCGLCHELHSRYGRKGQMLLSYDGTFLAIFLTGVYEPEENERMSRCLVHPAAAHREKANRFISYAADMNVLLAYLKAVDDWRDEKKETAKLLAVLLRSDYCQIRRKYPRQAKALLRDIRALGVMERGRRADPGQGSGLKAEQDGGTDPGHGSGPAADGKKDSDRKRSYRERMSEVLSRIDQAAGYTGDFMGELCVVWRDHWERDLRETGFYLGKFIYLIDAYDDLEKDEKTGNFNVLSELRELDEEHFPQILREILLDTAACCCRAFERLPIIQNVELLRNILYSGIWVRFHQISSGEGNEKKRPAWCTDE